MELNLVDGLINRFTSLGTERSKRSHFQWTYEYITHYQRYEAAYQSSWIARRICDVIPSDMIREWREIKSDDADEIRAEEDRLLLPNKIENALSLSRLYGGAGIVMITNQDLTQPLDPRKIKKGDLKRLVVLDRWLLGTGDMRVDDFLSEDFLSPAFFMVAGTGMVHHSHVVRIKGEPLPPRISMMAQGWGDSSLRQAMEVVEDFTASVAGVAEGMQEFNVDVIKREGLMEALSSSEENAIRKRFQLFGLMKSITNVALLDDREQFERKALSFAGISEIVEQQMKLVAGASHTPVTKLFGDSAKGLNATGEGDDVNYNAYIRSQQASTLDPALRKLDEVLVRSAIGNFPKDFNYVWNPLEVQSPNEMATANKTQADADIAYLDAGVVTVSQIQRNLQAAEKYQYDPKRIDDLEKAENEIAVEESLNAGQSQEEANEGAKLTPQTTEPTGSAIGSGSGVPNQAQKVDSNGKQ